MEKVYKIVEVVGCSPTKIEEAVENAVKEASRTLKGLAWFEVKEIRGGFKDGKIAEYQVLVRIGFRLIED
ncbi:MAG: dodecin [Candidatus Zixiibacteriota bacterium]